MTRDELAKEIQRFGFCSLQHAAVMVNKGFAVKDGDGYAWSDAFLRGLTEFDLKMLHKRILEANPRPNYYLLGAKALSRD